MMASVLVAPEFTRPRYFSGVDPHHGRSRRWDFPIAPAGSEQCGRVRTQPAKREANPMASKGRKTCST